MPNKKKTYTKAEVDALIEKKISKEKWAISADYQELFDFSLLLFMNASVADKIEEITEEQREWFRKLAEKTDAYHVKDLAPGMGLNGRVYFTRTPVAIQIALNLQSEIDQLRSQIDDMRSNPDSSTIDNEDLSRR